MIVEVQKTHAWGEGLGEETSEEGVQPCIARVRRQHKEERHNDPTIRSKSGDTTTTRANHDLDERGAERGAVGRGLADAVEERIAACLAPVHFSHGLTHLRVFGARWGGVLSRLWCGGGCAMWA